RATRKMPPNFCFSECAGNVSVAVGSRWRRIAERQRQASSSTVKRMSANILFVTFIVFGCGSLSAQTNVWQPSPGHTQVPIWPGAVPDEQQVGGPEAVLSNADWVVAGKPFVFVANVSRPTL